jgi:hypothetical protein
VSLLTTVPMELLGRGIAPAQETAAFALSLDVAEPWGGGAIAGRVERRGGKPDDRPITIELRCTADWLDLPGPFRPVPVWLERELWLERFELGPLGSANWLPFEFGIAASLPPACEGRLAAVRWRVEARRPRAIGHARASLPLLLTDPGGRPLACGR